MLLEYLEYLVERSGASVELYPQENEGPLDLFRRAKVEIDNGG